MEKKHIPVSKSSYSELQTQTDHESPISRKHVLVSPLDIESYLDSKNVSPYGDVDVELDDHPLISDDHDVESKSGSRVSGAVFNLTTTIVGAGIMALPTTIKVLGLVLGIFVIILMGILSEITVEFLVRFGVFVKAATYGDIVQSALGKPARILSEICIIVNNCGILVVYLIIMGDVLSGSLHHIGVFDQWLGNGVWDHRKLMILLILVVLLAPLCSLEKIDSLSMTSAASVALAVVFVVVCFVVAFIKLVEGKLEAPRLSPNFGSTSAILDLLVVIPIVSNAYVCHFNVQPIYNELENRSPHKMNRVGRLAIIICVVIYTCTASSGYLLFGEDTEADILTNFDKSLGIRFSSALNYIVRVGYVLHLVLVFPVVHFSLRETVAALIFEGSNPLLNERKRSLVLTGILLFLIYIGSTMIPNIWTAFKFTGATVAVSVGYIFPSLIGLRLSPRGVNLSPGERFLAWFMLITFVILGILGTIGNIYSLRSKS